MRMLLLVGPGAKGLSSNERRKGNKTGALSGHRIVFYVAILSEQGALIPRHQ